MFMENVRSTVLMEISLVFLLALGKQAMFPVFQTLVHRDEKRRPLPSPIPHPRSLLWQHNSIKTVKKRLLNSGENDFVISILFDYLSDVFGWVLVDVVDENAFGTTALFLVFHITGNMCLWRIYWPVAMDSARLLCFFSSLPCRINFRSLLCQLNDWNKKKFGSLLITVAYQYKNEQKTRRTLNDVI